MAFQTGLEGKPTYYGVIAGLVVGIGIFVIANMWLIKPKKATLAREEARLADLQTQVQEGRAAKLQLPRFREEVRRLELELDKLLRILPSRRNTPELLRRIRSLTEQGDFTLLRFTPGNIVDEDFYSIWPIGISLEGSYHNLALFFDRISRFSRIINIENLRISARSDDSDNTISASFNATTFIYNEEQEAESPE